MGRELKIRIDAYPDMEDRILQAGGSKQKQATYTYTYFNQPDGDVLKITKKPEGFFKTVLKAREGKFDIVSSDAVSNEPELMDELTDKFGIKKKLINHRTFFMLGQDKLSLNDIEGIGNFLIIEGQNPSLEMATRLGIPDPEIITVSFDNL
jgi:adenylate cyclase class IV